MKRTTKYPVVFICADAAAKAMRESDKYYQLGLSQANKPWEAAMYPLAFLQPKVHKSPLDFLSLQEIDYIVITHILYPPDRFKNHGINHAGFKPGANNYLNPLIDKYLQRYPLLDAFSKMHSHPAGGINLSIGDLQQNVFNSYSWFRSKGLNTMFSFVLTPSKNGWQFNGYGLTDLAWQKKLKIEFISRSHNLVKLATAVPYWKTPEGAGWCDDNKLTLKQAGYSVTRYTINRGWRRYVVKTSTASWLICLPPSFPQQTVKVYKVKTETSLSWENWSLPNNCLWEQPHTSFQQLDLVNLISLIQSGDNHG